MIDYKTIGSKIRKRRIACELSQEKLAEMCNVGTTHISHIKTGNCIPSLKVFIAILNALSCSADELICDELNNAERTYLSPLNSTSIIILVAFGAARVSHSSGTF